MINSKRWVGRCILSPTTWIYFPEPRPASFSRPSSLFPKESVCQPEIRGEIRVVGGAGTAINSPLTLSTLLPPRGQSRLTKVPLKGNIQLGDYVYSIDRSIDRIGSDRIGGRVPRLFVFAAITGMGGREATIFLHDRPRVIHPDIVGYWPNRDTRPGKQDLSRPPLTFPLRIIPSFRIGCVSIHLSYPFPIHLTNRDVQF